MTSSIPLNARHQALLKLLAIEPVNRGELPLITGWGIATTQAALDDLVRAGHVTYRNWRGRVYSTAKRQGGNNA